MPRAPALAACALSLTYAHEEEEDAEDVGDGQDGVGEGADYAAEPGDAAQEADDAEGAEDADDGGVALQVEQLRDRHGGDEAVEQVPGVADEGAEPVAEGVDAELGEEGEGEEYVEVVEEGGEGVWRGAGRGELREELRLDKDADKVLGQEGGAYYTVNHGAVWMDGCGYYVLVELWRQKTAAYRADKQ